MGESFLGRFGSPTRKDSLLYTFMYTYKGVAYDEIYEKGHRGILKVFLIEYLIFPMLLFQLPEKGEISPKKIANEKCLKK